MQKATQKKEDHGDDKEELRGLSTIGRGWVNHERLRG